MSRRTVNAVVKSAFKLVEEHISAIPRETYAPYESQALYRVPRDPDDAPALALALGGDAARRAVWTNDGSFLGCGVPTWTTETLSAHLRRRSEEVESRE